MKAVGGTEMSFSDRGRQHSSFIHLLIPSFNKYLLNICVSGIVPGAEDTIVKKTKNSICVLILLTLMGETSKINNINI